MAQYEKHILLFLVSFSCFMHFSNGYQFIVGGRNGWVLNPSENYNHWSGRMRFQVNDTLCQFLLLNHALFLFSGFVKEKSNKKLNLYVFFFAVFKYKSGSDSVLVVNKNDYDNCNTGNPILKLEDGNSIFKFDRSGPFYFISGNKANCDQGQKLIVVVLAVRNRPSPPPNAPSPAGGAPSPANSPSPASASPGPATHGSGPSPAAGAPGPATHGSGPSPASEAPGPGAHGSGPSPASGAPGPATDGSGLSPANASPGSPNSSTPGSGGTPADVNSPGGSPPRSLAAPPCTPSILLVSLVLSVGLGGFIVSH
ncbi:hypothetical protein DH2020_033581 [Rehmannia glutinosa]|uniref:Phytocyanin domain-containing protein n=1 Tax=Rehmannia glutinosa TaxID=99300 RepID=A0ABR0VBV0_REHGL